MTEKRTIGPVTAATTTAAAAVHVLCWALAGFGIIVPADTQGAATVVLVALAGYLVRPGGGKRAAR